MLHLQLPALSLLQSTIASLHVYASEQLVLPESRDCSSQGGGGRRGKGKGSRGGDKGGGKSSDKEPLTNQLHDRLQVTAFRGVS